MTQAAEAPAAMPPYGLSSFNMAPQQQATGMGSDYWAASAGSMPGPCCGAPGAGSMPGPVCMSGACCGVPAPCCGMPGSGSMPGPAGMPGACCGMPGASPQPEAVGYDAVQFGCPPRGGGGGFQEASDTSQVVEIPDGPVVNFIIGQKGQSINRLQMETGCQITIQKANEMSANQAFRRVTITGGDEAARARTGELLRMRVKEYESSRSADMQGPKHPMMGSMRNQDPSCDHGQWRYDAYPSGPLPSDMPPQDAAGNKRHLDVVPFEVDAGGRPKKADPRQEVTEAVTKEDARRIIGPRGVTIQKLREQSRAFIKIGEQRADPPPGAPLDVEYETMKIRGTPDQILTAQGMIKELLASPLGSELQGSDAPLVSREDDRRVEVQEAILKEDAKRLIGPGGVTITWLRQQSRAFIAVANDDVTPPAGLPPDRHYHSMKISGTKDQVEVAIQMIKDLLSSPVGTELGAPSKPGGKRTFVGDPNSQVPGLPEQQAHMQAPPMGAPMQQAPMGAPMQQAPMGGAPAQYYPQQYPSYPQ
mmetsp:Transcript_55876/g.92444  ORF Transcript_55876/g.92444 Transcript_55876/m.92444 type:complete len:533 (+) Transcript_55876:245-1843(+)